MSILLTGAWGYFGRALAVTLERRNYEVRRVGRPLTDVFDITSAKECDAIIHLAGGGAAGGAMPDAAAAHRDNVETAIHIASIAPKGCRLILASTIYVYGTGPRPFCETDPLAPDTLYGQLKAVAEAIWRQRGGTALRFAHIYGAGSGIDFGRDGVTERLARAAVGGPPFVMQGDGSQGIDLVHIDDACEAVARALTAQDLPPAVNVGGGAPVTVADLARAFGVSAYRDSTQIGIKYEGTSIRSAFSHPGRQQDGSVRFYESFKPAVDPRNVRAPSVRALDIALAAQVLGWAPRVTLAEGARGLIEMIRANTKE